MPIRLINIIDETETNLVRVNIANKASKDYVALRVDPHPAWAPDYRYVVFNGFVNGSRGVFTEE